MLGLCRAGAVRLRRRIGRLVGRRLDHRRQARNVLALAKPHHDHALRRTADDADAPAPSWLLRGAAKLKGIPCVICQGRHDCCTPVAAAWALHKQWPEAELEIIPDSGHLFSEPGMIDALVRATDRFADRRSVFARSICHGRRDEAGL